MLRATFAIRSHAHVGLALREPEEFARRWHSGEGPYSWRIFVALALTAIVGTLTYGLTMGLLGGPRRRAGGGQVHGGGRAGLGDCAALALYLQQPVGLAAPRQHDAVGRSRDHELGRTGDDCLDTPQLVFHRGTLRPGGEPYPPGVARAHGQSRQFSRASAWP